MDGERWAWHRIQENAGRKAPVRTYQDLLQNQNDEANFKYFAKSKLASVDMDGNINDFLGSDMYYGLSYSPDGNYLMVTTIHTPFSYLVPYYRFPQKTVIYDKTGKIVFFDFTMKAWNELIETNDPDGYYSEKIKRRFSLVQIDP